MSQPVSLSRLYVLRGLYLLNFALVGSGAVAAFIHRTQPWDSVSGVAYAFWAALAVMSLLGLRHPLAMLPLLFVQLLYKLFWLLAVYLPLRSVGRSSDMVLGFLIGAALDVVAIPWPYVFARYVSGEGDPWTAQRQHNETSEEHHAA